MTEFQTVIGLEFHAELKTKTKIFCSCPTTFAGEPNTHVCPVCLGLPGVLPVLNKRAVELAMKAGLALNCQISPFSKFDRKNYFYPDLPKAYQVTQYPLPICKSGYITVPDADGNEKNIRINRIHLEEDAGKLVHSGESITTSNYSLPDYNRAAVPLIEIVSEPDMASAEEAKAFGDKLKLILEYAGVSDVKMEQGSLRCDVNISLMPKGSDKLGTKVEIKNLNSFRAMHRAIQFEEDRQRRMIERGEKIVQETRTWDEGSGQTLSMRSKENDHDYRYFPEPDLVPTVITPEWIEAVRSELPELPDKREKRLKEECGLSYYDCAQIVATPALAFFFDEVAKIFDDKKTIANWLIGDVSRLINVAEKEYEQIPIAADDLAYLLEQAKSGAINNNSAKAVLEEMFASGKKPAEIISERGFAQISDSSALEEAVKAVIEANAKAAEDFRAGKQQAMGFLMGQVMKATKGQANPNLVKELLAKMLK